MLPIHFKAKLCKIGSYTLILLPKIASAKLPSRGMAMAEGTINDFHFQVALEPDGKGSHWFKVKKNMREGASAEAGDTVILKIEPIKKWPEPTLPLDLKNALTSVPQAHTLWQDLTTMARWDFLRWIGSTKQLKTRKRRIEIALSKLIAGERRPCCFNRSMCTDPSVSKNGVLSDP